MINKNEYEKVDLDQAWNKVKDKRTTLDSLIDAFVMVSSTSLAGFLLIYGGITTHSQLAFFSIPFIWAAYFYHEKVVKNG